jgi:hypothetical protein
MLDTTISQFLSWYEERFIIIIYNKQYNYRLSIRAFRRKFSCLFKLNRLLNIPLNMQKQVNCEVFPLVSKIAGCFNYYI